MPGRTDGALRVSLTYDDRGQQGKTDTYRGHFARRVPDRQAVEVLELETEDPDPRSETTVTTTLTDADGGADALVAYGGLPHGVSAEDDELGTRMALSKLAAVVEST